MPMKVPKRAPIRLTRSLKKGMASAIMKLIEQFPKMQELERKDAQPGKWHVAELKTRRNDPQPNRLVLPRRFGKVG